MTSLTEVLQSLPDCSICRKVEQPQNKRVRVEKNTRFLVVYSGTKDSEDEHLKWKKNLRRLGVTPSVWLPTVWCSPAGNITPTIFRNCSAKMLEPVKSSLRGKIRGVVLIGRTAISAVIGRFGTPPQPASINGRPVVFQGLPMLLLLEWDVMKGLDPASKCLRNRPSDVRDRIKKFVEETT